jgi:predicted GIY-YIG superfamily endonuclease
MSRRAPAGPRAREPGWVYTLHLDPPLEHAKHYTGWKKAAEGQAKDLEHRLSEHEHGQGARLTQVQLERGGTWRLASVEAGTRDRETQLKERGASRRCPICKDEAQVREPEAEQELEAGL